MFIFSGVYMVSYLHFLLKSTNQHGVHSPFVYNYITKGLYKHNKLTKATPYFIYWLQQSINYFNTKTYFLNTETEISDILKTKKVFNLHEATVIICKYNSNDQNFILNTIKDMSKEQILLLALHTYPEKFLAVLRNDPDITLVVDCFYGCLISKRTEQPKQNFFIRF